MFEVNNLTNINLLEETKEIEEYLKYVINYLKLDKVIFSIIIVDNKYIKEINKKYRDKDIETDVISFAFEDNLNITLEERVLGDIYISYDKVIEQSQLYNHSKLRELLFLITHGFLHLLGYDHLNSDDEEIMFSLQEEVLSSYGIKR